MIAKLPLGFKLLIGFGIITIILGLLGIAGVMYENNRLCHFVGLTIGYTKLLAFPIGIILILSIFVEA
jgi:hypothetical protein